MVFNRIQFQPGMSIPQFLRSFGTEAQCAESLKAARWPQGFRCPHCSSVDHFVVGHGAHKLFRCNGCRHQTSLTAGSLVEHAKLPLTTWFLALKRQLGVSFPIAWLMQQKISQTMGREESTQRLGGEVQIDEAHRGQGQDRPRLGEQGAIRGCGLYQRSRAPVAFEALCGQWVHHASAEHWAKANLTSGAEMPSDGFGCFTAVTGAGYLHLSTIVSSLKPRDLPEFKWVNPALGNLKTTLADTFRSLKYRDCADH